MDEQRKESFLKHRCELFKGEKHLKDVMSVFDDWSQNYDKDFQFYEYSTYKKIVDVLLKVMATKDDITRNCSVLDVCAGTGLVGEQLRSMGFKGQIDAVDGSSGMLEIAKAKEGVYKNIFCYIIEPDTSMPQELSESNYDVAIACACFRDIFLHWSCLKHLVNAVRIGGLIVFGIRRVSNQKTFDFNIEMEKEIFRLESKGVLKLLDLQFNSQFRKQDEENDAAKSYGCVDYCFEKLAEHSG